MNDQLEQIYTTIYYENLQIAEALQNEDVTMLKLSWRCASAVKNVLLGAHRGEYWVDFIGCLRDLSTLRERSLYQAKWHLGIENENIDL